MVAVDLNSMRKLVDEARAAEAYDQLLTARRRLLGESAPLTLAAWGSFAYWRGKAGDAAGAADAFAELLELMARVLGDKHPHIQIIRYNLAHWRSEAGKRGSTGG
ncbi:hypothetical protein [Streptomyces sp. H27-D2]|uniref:hypothetical protein n=1 Tax=Streptomyces sp. H27-D2 TaxID=3046304 RepID=UPI002DBCB2A0|nr:hypothetical protein [Streptomyces sp. H27-D2]MEC4018261.1 hypothetical protein [Streptomyces sp. H27-D2]